MQKKVVFPIKPDFPVPQGPWCYSVRRADALLWIQKQKIVLQIFLQRDSVDDIPRNFPFTAELRRGVEGESRNRACHNPSRIVGGLALHTTQSRLATPACRYRLDVLIQPRPLCASFPGVIHSLPRPLICLIQRGKKVSLGEEILRRFLVKGKPRLSSTWYPPCLDYGKSNHWLQTRKDSFCVYCLPIIREERERHAAPWRTITKGSSLRGEDTSSIPRCLHAHTRPPPQRGLIRT